MNNTQTPKPTLPQQKTLDFRTKYKTEKCRYWSQKGYCPYNQTCTFAHYDEEIRDKTFISTNYKTKPCINFTSKGFCTYGDRCQYLHFCQNKQSIEDGRKTRSNSQESNSSQSSKRPTKTIQNVWSLISHNKRIQLIKNLGLDFAVRHSSRLIQLLKSHQIDEYSLDEDIWPDQLTVEKKEKKYSL